MDLIEILRNIIVAEGVMSGRSLQELSKETGLSVEEVIEREVDLDLVPGDNSGDGSDRARSNFADTGSHRTSA